MKRIEASDGRTLDLASVMWLLCRAGRLLALPLENVVEIMRPLPVEALPGAPDVITGLSIIRGSPVAVVSAALLFGGRDDRAGRLVTMRIGDRLIALAVQEVLGVRSIDRDRLTALPPLLQAAAGDAVQAIGTRDGELLLMLSRARLVPEAVFDSIPATGAGL